MTEIMISARDIQVGDVVTRVPVGTEQRAHLAAHTVESGGGVVGVWIGEGRGKWRPADYVFNHGDPVHVERESLEQKIARLNDEVAEADRQQREFRKREVALREEIDALALQARPTYPTAAQVIGMDEALVRLIEGKPAESHHGDPCGPDDQPYVVVVEPKRGFVSIRHGAPYAKRRIGSHLWHFTDAEVDAFVKWFLDQGWDVASFWRHGEGLSLLVDKSA